MTNRSAAAETLEARVLMVATLPAGFQETIYTTGFDTPTAQAFAPDGRLFVLEKAGKVRVVTAAGALNSTPFLSLAVDTAQDRGLVALAFDPNFQSNGYLYLWYTKTDTAGTRNRLARVTASPTNPNVAQPGSELVLLEVPHATNIHTGGAMGFGADGMLYLGVGDGGESNNAQDLGDLRGKVLRLNVSNPTNLIPADNPYVNTPGARKEIFALGLRNPFTGQVKPGTNTLYVNDVGEAQFEEVNVVAAGKNYGWPAAEGPSTNAAFTNPLHAYSHAGFSSAAITGAAFYTGANQFPAEYAGSYFFADYLNGFMRRIDASGNAQGFGTNLAGPLDIDLGPDGSLYYISAFGNGFSGTNRPVYKISYAASANRAPAAVATATTPTNGAALPLTVGFTGNGSSDPDGDALTYSWNFGDGTSATGKDVTHAYAARGTYFATLTVSDGRGGTNTSPSIRVDAGNAAPTGTIATPGEGVTYRAGETVDFSGSGTDPEDGSLAASRLSWMVYLVHNTHEHQFAGPFDGATSGSFVVPFNGHVENDHHYRIELTVTDSAGLAQKTSRRINPVVSTLTVTTNIAGLSVVLDGQPRVGPFASGSLVGATRNLSAPATQALNGTTYEFVSWSDGGAATHDVTVPAANTTYTATYRVAAPTQTKLNPTADTYARDGSYAGSNFGAAATLYAKKAGTGYNRHAFLKFDTSAVAGDVTAVKLRVYGRLEGGTNVVTNVFGTSSGWTESGLTWKNKPAPVGTRLAGITVANSTGKYYEVDVTAYVNAERAAGRKVVAFALINPKTSTPATLFNSRQASSNKPELVLTVGAAPPPAPSQTPFGGTAIALPGTTIQAEDFDNGGEGVAYHDVTSANEGNATAYRAGVAVDLETVPAGGFNVGWIKASEWLEYTVNVATAGTYDLELRVASLGQGGQISVLIDGSTVAGGIAIPDTGGYQTYQTVTRAGVVLPAGQHVLRISADSEGASGFTGNIDWLRFVAAAVPTAPAAPSGLSALAASATQVDLAWTDNSTNETGFKIERKTGTAGAWAQIATTTLASYADTGRAGGTLYVYRVRATNAAGDSAYSAEASVTTPPPAGGGQAPFAGGPWAIPGTIEMENFDEGGEGVAYHDSDGTNQGGAYRAGVGVDLEAAGDTGGGHNVGWIKAGEWLEYTVNVAASGAYNFEIRVASGNPGGTFHIEFGGVDKTGPIALPYTGSWTTWQTVTANGVNLTAGTYVMRVAIDASNLAGGDVGRINWVRVTSAGGGAGATQSPFAGSPAPVPGRIEAENFDNGGEAVAYHDSDAVNVTGAYRTGVGADIEPTTDTGGGFNVGHVKAGEWLEYTLDVPAAGTYVAEVRVASGNPGGTFHLEFNGVDKTGALDLPYTGGWQSWQTVAKTVTLDAGTQVMRLSIDSSSGGGDVGNVNWIRLSKPAAGINWAEVKAAPFAREEAQGVAHGGKLFVFGGLFSNDFLATDRIDVYDPATNLWSTRGAMPEKLTHAATVVDGNTAWFVGGYVGNHPGPATNQVWKYDLVNDAWSRGPDLPAERGAGGVALLGRRLHFFGGMERTRTIDKGEHWSLDLDTPGATWQTRAALPDPRNHLGGIALGGKAYAIGGQRWQEAASVNSEFVDAYDPATDAWTRVAALPSPRSHFNAATFILNGKITLVAGEVKHNEAAADVWEYDPAQNRWAVSTPLPQPRRALVANVINGEIIATGGYLAGPQLTTTWRGTPAGG